MAISACCGAYAQSASALPNAPAPRNVSADAVTLRDTPRHILGDQAAIWTSPLRIRPHDLTWLVPLAGAEAAAIATDHRAMSQVVSQNPSFNQDNVNVSNVLVGGIIALPVAIYGYGHFESDGHARTAGILSGESILDGLVVEQGMKLIFWRQRPGTGSHERFFQSSAGVDSAFPSSHSVLAFAAAAELAGEYPSVWKQTALYSTAAAISLTRVLGQQHSPGDVLAGAAAGWLVGHYVFRAHHHPHRSRFQP